MKRILIAPLVVMCLWSQASLTATDSDINSRLQNIEDRLSVIEDQSAYPNDATRKGMTVSGYADASYAVDSRKDINPSFQLRHLSLFFTQNINRRWHFFSEIEFEHAPKFESGDQITVQDCGADAICGNSDDSVKTINTLSSSEGQIFTEALNLNYKWRPTANIRIGRFFTPAGIWSIDHYPPFVATLIRPKHIRKIFPQLTDGAMVYGITSLFDHFISYDFYLGNGEGNSAYTDLNTNKAAGVRLEMDLPVLHQSRIGVSYYQEIMNDGTDKSASGFHTKLRWAGYEIQAEYADARLTTSANDTYRRRGYYIQGQYRFRDWSVGLRHDFYNPDSRLDNSETTRSIFGSYYISEDLNIKLEHHIVALTDPAMEDYDTTILSLNANLGN